MGGMWSISPVTILMICWMFVLRSFSSFRIRLILSAKRIGFRPLSFFFLSCVVAQIVPSRTVVFGTKSTVTSHCSQHTSFAKYACGFFRNLMTICIQTNQLGSEHTAATLHHTQNTTHRLRPLLKLVYQLGELGNPLIDLVVEQWVAHPSLHHACQRVSPAQPTRHHNVRRSGLQTPCLSLSHALARAPAQRGLCGGLP